MARLVNGTVIHIKFFSLVREAIDTDAMELELPEGDTSVAAIKQRLAAQHGDVWQEVLSQPNLVHAVNQRVVNPDHTVQDGDEVAFFPPMTGG